MITFRRICIVLVVTGAAFLFFRREGSLPTLPVPSTGLRVKGVARVASAGDYYVCVTMPKQDDSITLDSEVVPCSMEVCVGKEGQPAERKVITSLDRYGEFGFGRVQFYRGGDAFRLGHGEHEVEVFSKGACAATTSRGATLTFEQDVGNPTDCFLRSMLKSWFATASLCGGLLGLIMCEIKRPNQRPEANAGKASVSSSTPPAGESHP